MTTGPIAAPRSPDLFEYYQPLTRILSCPRSGGALRMVAVADLPESLFRGQSFDVLDPMSALLVSDEAQIAYPVFGIIISFLAEHEISINSSDYKLADDNGEAIKRSVTEYYDTHGWQKNPEGVYHDTAGNAAEQGPYRTYERQTNLDLLENWSGGEFILDAASGAIAMTEYLAYSCFFRHRVCVDMSYMALKQACQKLGTKGFYVLSDICRLPFSDDVFEGVVSGYTIQHIPFDQQERAVGQLYRVLRPGKTACIVTAYSGHPVRDLGLKLWHAFRNPQSSAEGGNEARPQLYMATQPLRWWRKTARELGALVSIRSFRLLGKREFELYCRNSYRMMRAMRSLETLFPQLLAPLSAIVCVNLAKPLSTESSVK